MRKASDGLSLTDLTSTTADDIAIRPLYTADTAADVDLRSLRSILLGAPPFTRGVTRPGGRWDLRQRHDLGDPAAALSSLSSAASSSASSSSSPSLDSSSPSAAASAIREDLDGGVTSIWLRLLSPPAADALKETLAGVDLQETPVILDGGPWYAEAARALGEATDGAPTLASAPADPLGALARQGWLPESIDETLGALGDRMADRVRSLSGLMKSSKASERSGAQPPQQLPRAPHAPGDVCLDATRTSRSASSSLSWPHAPRDVCLDATPYADAGAPPALEIACLLATGAAYLEAVCARGVDASAAASLMEARVAVTTDQFNSLAKLRAARTAWDRLLAECGAPPALRPPLRCWAVTSEADISAFDPSVNLVRSTISAFAAVCGGADCLTVLPHDAATADLGERDLGGRVPNTHSDSRGRARRLARNVSHLLAEESHLGAVHDPAGGSWYVETYTQRLAAAAWDRFRDISARGGLAACLLDGSLAADVLSAWQRRLDRIAAGGERVVGVTHYRSKPDEPGSAGVSDESETAAAAPMPIVASGQAADPTPADTAPPAAGVSIPPLPLRRPHPDHVPERVNSR